LRLTKLYKFLSYWRRRRRKSDSFRQNDEHGDVNWRIFVDETKVSTKNISDEYVTVYTCVTKLLLRDIICSNNVLSMSAFRKETVSRSPDHQITWSKLATNFCYSD